LDYEREKTTQKEIPALYMGISDSFVCVLAFFYPEM